MIANIDIKTELAWRTHNDWCYQRVARLVLRKEDHTKTPLENQSVHMVRVSFCVDPSFDCQSTVKVDRYNGEEWKELIPSRDIKLFDCWNNVRDGKYAIDVDMFSKDALKLLQEAADILE